MTLWTEAKLNNIPGAVTQLIKMVKPTLTSPKAPGAGIIGTAQRGPAFVPVSFSTLESFELKFGKIDGSAFGPLAVQEWIQTASSATYIRLLGAGDCKARTTSGLNTGKVNNAGFVVGSELVQSSNGMIGANPYAGENGIPGRTYFLGCFMSESAGSTIFSEAGLVHPDLTGSIPIIRGVLMAPSGVLLSLNSAVANHNHPNSIASGAFGYNTDTSVSMDGGLSFGDVFTKNIKGEEQALRDFVLILNGFKTHTQTVKNIEGGDAETVTETIPNAITASFDSTSVNYFPSVLNTDPLQFEQRGHYLYSYFDVNSTFAVITGSGMTGHNDDAAGRMVQTAFLLTGSVSRNSGSLTYPGGATAARPIGIPNFESFEDRYRTAYSPWVVSQKIGRKNHNLFRLHALNDGVLDPDDIKITIAGLVTNEDILAEYGKFDLIVKRFDRTDRSAEGVLDEELTFLENHPNLTLDPGSPDFIARRIGDMHDFYDFDKKPHRQKLVRDGTFPNQSDYVRVEVAPEVLEKSLDRRVLPTGFRGLDHLVTSGSVYRPTTSVSQPILVGASFGTGGDVAASTSITDEIMKRVVQPPVPLRENIIDLDDTGKKIKSADYTWGVQFSKKDSLSDPNKNGNFDPSLRSFTRYMPSYHTDFQNAIIGNNEGVPDRLGCVRDADRYNNNFFTLERIEVITGSDGKVDKTEWPAALYRRNGVVSGTLLTSEGASTRESRFVDINKDLSLSSRNFLKFTFPLQGGFDGLNIFDHDKKNFLDYALRKEIEGLQQGGVKGPTVAAYRKALDLFEEKDLLETDIKLLVTPGARHWSVTDYALDAVQSRFDSFYIMDLEEKDDNGDYVTGSIIDATQPAPNVNVTNTINSHVLRNHDSSFAAVYFPDVILKYPINSPLTGTYRCPPSVGVLGILAKLDVNFNLWDPPTGVSKGRSNTCVDIEIKLSEESTPEVIEALLQNDINPISKIKGSGPVLHAQKTLLKKSDSVLDRIHVRRLMIEIRRAARNVARGLLFEQNRKETLKSFDSLVSNELADIQKSNGMTYEVKIDTTTTTDEDIQNNVIRGEIRVSTRNASDYATTSFGPVDGTPP